MLKVENNQAMDVSKSRHYPYGEMRYSGPPAGTPTNYRFTGQQSAALGLYHMGARWYDPYINRFVSPDTIIPHPANPQNLNRFSYCLRRAAADLRPAVWRADRCPSAQA